MNQEYAHYSSVHLLAGTNTSRLYSKLLDRVAFHIPSQRGRASAMSGTKVTSRSAMTIAIYRRSRELVLPILRFPDKLVFDDGTRRVELLYLGVSHTHGDGWAWLPEERILFSGDAAVNGPHNFVGDGDTRPWPATLEKAQALRPRIVGVGHGPLADGAVLEDQKSFFETLHRVVSEERRAGRSAAELQERIESLRAEVVSNERIARYVGRRFAAQIEKVWIEQGGEAFESSPLEAHRLEHQAHHVGR